MSGLIKPIHWTPKTETEDMKHTVLFVPVCHFFIDDQENQIKEALKRAYNKYNSEVISIKIKEVKIDFRNIGAEYDHSKLICIQVEGEIKINEVMSGYKRKRINMTYSGSNCLVSLELAKDLGLIDNNNQPRKLKLGEMIYVIEVDTNNQLYEYIDDF